jgi:hypothetical protein
VDTELVSRAKSGTSCVDFLDLILDAVAVTLFEE